MRCQTCHHRIDRICGYDGTPSCYLIVALLTLSPGSLHAEQRQEVQFECWLQVQGHVLCNYQLCEGVARGASSAAAVEMGQVRSSRLTTPILLTASREVFSPMQMDDEPDSEGPDVDSLAAQLTRQVEMMMAQDSQGSVS